MRRNTPFVNGQNGVKYSSYDDVDQVILKLKKKNDPDINGIQEISIEIFCFRSNSTFQQEAKASCDLLPQ